ncbi:MAG: hypothetical protein IPN29_09900 [Saprospiraceae bacterium]|nr:hypothetical protein [Saprospiraceae bacterium]
MTKYFWTIILNPGKADYDISHHWPGKINKQHHLLGCVVIIYVLLVAVSGKSIVYYHTSLLAIVFAADIFFPFRAALANFFPATFLWSCLFQVKDYSFSTQIIFTHFHL